MEGAECGVRAIMTKRTRGRRERGKRVVLTASHFSTLPMNIIDNVRTYTRQLYISNKYSMIELLLWDVCTNLWDFNIKVDFLVNQN